MALRCETQQRISIFIVTRIRMTQQSFDFLFAYNITVENRMSDKHKSIKIDHWYAGEKCFLSS